MLVAQLLRMRPFLLLLRRAIDQRFLASAGGVMVMVISRIVENSGAASGCHLILVLLLILLMLATTSTSSGASASTSPVPEVLPLTLGRQRLLLLAIAVTVRQRYSDATVTVETSGSVILGLLFAVDVRRAASVVVMMVCRAVGGRIATRRLCVHRLDISVGFVRVTGILRSSATPSWNSFVR